MNEEFLNNLATRSRAFYLLFDREKCDSREFVINSMREFFFILVDIDWDAEKERQRNLFTINKPKEAAYIQYYNEKLNGVVRHLISLFNNQVEKYYNIDYSNKPIETLEVLRSLNNDLVFDQIIEREKKFLSECPPINDLEDIQYRESFTKNLTFVEQAKKLIKSIEQKFPVDISSKRGELKHRHEAIIYKYKVQAKYTNPLSRTEIKDQFGKAREKAVDTINEYSKAYRPIKAAELEIIIPHLSEFQLAQKAAINDLDRIKNDF